MNELTSLMGLRISPHGLAIFLLVWGLLASLFGWFIALRRTGVAESTAGRGDRTRQDAHVAYGRGGPPRAARPEGSRRRTKNIAWVLAVLGPAAVVTGVVQLVG
ncbi:hypothetical protein [Streptomyces laurentii]|uniref:hypothetical protein n=1 Tax=Streptomyces laurentii TaxID=39478 RepID=UPI0036AFA7D7